MIMPGPDGDTIRSTGGQVDDIVMALIDAAYDRDDEVRETVGDALFDLGKNKPALVLSSCHTYLKKHSKLALGHRVVILQATERIIKEKIDDLDSILAVDLIKQASQELTQSKEIEPEWQTAASGVLVALGCKYCDEVMDEMLQKFQPGSIPHFFVVQTLGKLASANVYGMVPHLKAVLGTMLPMMGATKHDNIRWVFAAALSKFSEAILDYIANIDKAPDPSVRKESFSGEIFSAFDVLFNVWLVSKEAKLRLIIVEALGNMTHLMSRNSLDEQFPKILQGVLGLYKRHPEHFYITQGLCMVLDAVCVEGNFVVEPHLDNLFNILFQQIIMPLDYNNSLSIKNFNEVLRCFSVLARSFSGKMIGQLLQKLENANEKHKIGILTIFKHLINSGGSAMEDKQEVVVSGLKSVLNESSNKVKKTFAQVIIAMAHHGYLEHEGGQLMVEFIIKQCSLPDDPPGKRPTDPDYVSKEQLRSMCDNVLQLITTTIERMEVVLWPYLLEPVVQEQNTEATGTVCKCLAFLSYKMREENGEDFEIDYDVQANLPKPVTVIARFLIMAGRPTNGRSRGIHVLNAMKGLSPNLNENLVELWDTVIPKLVQYLDDATGEEEKFSQKNWEDLLLKMLSKSLDVVDSEDWTSELGETLGSHIPMYTNMHEEKNFLYKCLGIIMRKSTKRDFVNKHLDLVFQTVKHTDQVEREGCAIAMGYSAASHLDAVLGKLETVAKTDMVRKSSGILSFMKDKSESDVERIKATLLFCYGYVALYSPPSLLISRMEATILRTITPYFSNIRDPSVKLNLIRTVDLIGTALHPDHLQMEYNFTNRADLLTHLQSYMKAEPLDCLLSEIRALIFKACATLVKLDPPLSEAVIFDLAKNCIDCIFPLPQDGMNTKKVKEESYEETLEIQSLLQITFDEFHDLLKEIIKKNFTANGLESIFKHLVSWFTSVNDHERLRALTTWKTVLKFFREAFSSYEEDMCGQKFQNEGELLASLIPRCSDPNVDIRQTAIDCVQELLRVALRFAGSPEDHRDDMVEALATLRERAKKSDPTLLFSVVNDLSKVISKKLPDLHLQPFTYTLIDGLTDSQSHSSSGACVVLNSIMKSRGGELMKEVDKILLVLHDKLGRIEFNQTTTGTLRTVKTMASHHMIPVITSILTYHIPFDEHMIEILKVLAKDGLLCSSIIDHLLDLLSKKLPYEEKTDSRENTVRTATLTPLAATCILKEICLVEESEEQIISKYHRMFAALMIHMGTMVGNKPPKQQQVEREEKSKERKRTLSSSKPLNPCGMAAEAFKAFLERSKSGEILEVLNEEDCWKLFEDEDEYPEAYRILARALISSENQKQYVSSIVACLTVSLSSLYDPQRVVVAAFFAELIYQRCAEDSSLVELVMNSLLGRLVDSSHKVRMLCIRGLGNISSLGTEVVQKYSTTVLSAMMAGMDDKEDPDDDITIEAMSGLSRVLTEIDESHIRPILINVALRIRPCFEKDKPAVRSQSLLLFGNLSRFGDGPSRPPFLEQIHSNFISLLLHLNDPELEVKKACKHCLRLIGPLLESTGINTKFQKHLLEEANLHYGEFMNDLAKLIIQDFPDKVNFYITNCISFYKSIWPEIKSNAAMFSGFLLGNLPPEKQTNISKEHVCSALILLLKDSSSLVRSKAAEALSLLYEY